MTWSNQAELVELPRELDRRLAKVAGGRKVEVFVFGGAAVVVAYGAPRGTDDLDLWVQDSKVESRLVEWGREGSELERRHGISVEPANTTLMMIEDPDWMERAVEILPGTFSAIRALAVGKEDLILSKLARYDDRDRQDIEHLVRNCGVDVDKLIRFYKSARRYFVGNLSRVDLTFKLVLHEYFGRENVELDDTSAP